MKKQKIEIHFSPPKHGWLNITVTSNRESILISASSNFDPFDDFFHWLEELAENRLPCKWMVYEEGPYMEFEVLGDKLGKARFLLKGTARDINYNVSEVFTFIDEIVDPHDLAHSFYKSFREYIDTGFDSSQWGSGSKNLVWRRIRNLQY